ncbi:MAG: hypothetical protein N2204_04465, partial [Anaerolineae bacterium]|nr:hypothetical protein [Anaerolineae bacterium]
DVYKRQGLSAAILFHALHNLGASLTAVSVGAILISFYAVLTGIGLVLAMIVLGVRQEKQWVREELADEVGGALTEAEYAMLLSRRERKAMERAIYRAKGPEAARIARLFQETATELAFRKRRLRYRADDARLVAQVKALRERLAQTRAALVPLSPQSATRSG